jgi:hypothetical protein
MRERPDMRGLRLAVILVVVFTLGVLLSSGVSNAQYMRSDVTECRASCNYGAGHALCLDTCTNVPAGKSCTCTCNADNLIASNGECSNQCDYGNQDDSYCPGGGL